MKVSKEDIIKLKLQQEDNRFHPLTCCGHNDCERAERKDEGILIPTENGWVCPCGEWTQNYKIHNKK